MKRKITIIFVFIFSLFMFAACAKKNNWNYSKEDLIGSVNVEGLITSNNDSKTITFDSKDLYKKNPSKKDLYVIDLEKALLELENKEYLTYDIVKSCNVAVDTIQTKDNITTITFGSDASQYAVIINKSVIKDSKYAFVSTKAPSFGNVDMDLLTFEDNYLTSEFEWSPNAQIVIQTVTQIGMIVAGATLKTPISVAGGVINIFSNFASALTSSSVSNAEILNKLDEMDEKLDNISKKLDENYEQLLTESIKTQAMVNTVILNQQKDAITSYVTTLQLPIDNYTNDFADYIEQSYKALVRSNDDIEVSYKRDDSSWKYLFNFEKSDEKETIIIENIEYTNSLKFLADNNNIVRKGFMDELEKDLLAACSKINLPSYISKDELVKLAMAKLSENFTQNYYIENHQKALEIRNLVTNLTKRIAGIDGFDSIVDTYIARLEYMYNFASEIKAPVANILSSMMYELDNVVSLALESCMYAEVNYDELEANYKLAREKIQNRYNEVKNLPDGLSFITTNVWKGGYYSGKYDVSYKNIGNHPDFKAEFAIYKHIDGIAAKDDIKSKRLITDADIEKIRFRMDLLQQLGLDDSKAFIEYLNKCNVISNDSMKQYESLIANKKATEHDYKILSEVFVRNLNDKDVGMSIVCAAYGNSNSVCFNVGDKYKYREKYDAKLWSGKMLSAKFFDGKTAQKMKEENVCAYATFYDSHWYWVDDEIFAFVDSLDGNCFFLLEYN